MNSTIYYFFFLRGERGEQALPDQGRDFFCDLLHKFPLSRHFKKGGGGLQKKCNKCKIKNEWKRECGVFNLRLQPQNRFSKRRHKLYLASNTKKKRKKKGLT